MRAKGRALGADEVKALVSGTAVRRDVFNGSTQTWTNGANGELIGMATNSRGQIGAAAGNSGTGKFRIDENGRYCATLCWNRGAYSCVPSNPCWTLFNVGGQIVGLDQKSQVEGFGFTGPRTTSQ